MYNVYIIIIIVVYRPGQGQWSTINVCFLYYYARVYQTEDQGSKRTEGSEKKKLVLRQIIGRPWGDRTGVRLIYGRVAFNFVCLTTSAECTSPLTC